MDLIPYFERSAYLSLMGLILPLALIASALLLTTVWKTPEGPLSARLFVQTALITAAMCWTLAWGVAVQDHEAGVDEAAADVSVMLGSTYGISVGEEDARAIVTDTLGDRTFKGSAEGALYLLTGSWEDDGFHLNTVGQEISVLPAFTR